MRSSSGSAADASFSFHPPSPTARIFQRKNDVGASSSSPIFNASSYFSASARCSISARPCASVPGYARTSALGADESPLALAPFEPGTPFAEATPGDVGERVPFGAAIDGARALELFPCGRARLCAHAKLARIAIAMQAGIGRRILRESVLMPHLARRAAPLRAHP